MQVPGRSIRPGNFHRGRQDVSSSMPSSLGFLRGTGESLRRVFSVLFRDALCCFPFEYWWTFIFRLIWFLISAEPVNPSALPYQLDAFMFRR